MMDLSRQNPDWKDPLLCQSWELTDNEGTGMKFTFHPIRLFSTLHLFADGTFLYTTTDSIYPGKWIHDQEDIVLQFQNTRITLSIRKVSEEKLKVFIRKNYQSQEITFSSDGIVHKNPENDPWYPANNTWRIKPQAPESNGQIKERIKNYLHFFSLFLRDNKKRDKSIVDWRGIPTVIGFYSNGISLYQADKIEDAWYNCFYSDDQAMTAYNMIKGVMDNKSINCKDDSQGWVMLDACFLEGVYSEIK